MNILYNISEPLMLLKSLQLLSSIEKLCCLFEPKLLKKLFSLWGIAIAVPRSDFRQITLLLLVQIFTIIGNFCLDGKRRTDGNILRFVKTLP
jgi:hypothetical protein